VFAPRDWQALAQDLEGVAARRAFTALHALAAESRETLWHLREPPRRPEAATPERIDRLIADLAGDEFPVRQRAEKELEKMGEWAVPALRALLGNAPALDVRQRAERILAVTDPPPPPRERLFHLHVVDLLERIGNTEARRQLERLAAGPKGARLARESREALDRLAKSAE
jgi:hypothetical protein